MPRKLSGTASLVLTTCIYFLLNCSPLCGAEVVDPEYYLRKTTWIETMLASRAALAKYQARTARQLFASDVLRAGHHGLAEHLPGRRVDQVRGPSRHGVDGLTVHEVADRATHWVSFGGLRCGASLPIR